MDRNNMNCKGSYYLGSACGHCSSCEEELKKLKELDTCELPTKMILRMDKNDLSDFKSIKTYPMYYSGWECDADMWVLSDGRKFTTDHGALCEFTDEQFKKYRKKLKNYLKEIKDL